ncbi:MAG: 3-deoxy-manno-octulosonate cytidylyltransferase [Lachnospiraceae bacterium]|nr:3-deoxy-manno-octulosonate cytidylyltransferase [Lachnospiraceae bacterium]
MKVVGVIPARYGSTRLPGKPLKDICGKPMIWWVYHQVIKASRVDNVVVATDDERISSVLEEMRIPYVMTRNDHPTAANRIAEVAESLAGDFFLQLNGDEPLIDEKIVDMVVPDTIGNIECGTNIITKMHSPAEVNDQSNIKVVFDENYNALYMSRFPIPAPVKSISFDYYKHVGIIGYSRKMLDFYKNSVPGRLEKIEGIDTLRFLDYGKKLHFVETEHSNSLSVDTEMDLEKVRKIISGRCEYLEGE